MKTRIELLAPAGSIDALHAAVENGADAVYLGGKLFNARQQADNFDTDVLKEALDYAHARGVNIYLTLNTLVSDSEMKQALLFAAEAGAAGIDGIIVQDIGLAAALRRTVPEIPLHASTQMTIYDLDGAKALEEAGFQRVVLARELTLDEASHIAGHTTLEVEAFVHGALCICYSGQCLMSSIIGGRSGNRGKCAQPCRLPYELTDESENGRDGLSARPATDGGRKAGYLLSPKDISTLEHIGEIAASGIHSLKIEGRMKSPEYVAVVVRIYRKYLDIALEQLQKGNGSKVHVSEDDMHDLLQIFNRGGFSAGYWKGKTGADMMGYEKPNNSGIYLGTVTSYDSRSQMAGIRLTDRLSIGDGVEIWTGGSDSPGGVVTSIRKGGAGLKTAGKGDLVDVGSFKGKIPAGSRVYKTTDALLLKQARESFTGRDLKRIGIFGRTKIKAGQPLLFQVWDNDGHTAEAEGTILPEMALTRPLTAERLEEQLRKTGSTPFVFDVLQVEMEEGLSLPVSEINEVRRRALDDLMKSRTDRYHGRRSMEGKEQRVDELLSVSVAASKTKPSLPDDSYAPRFSLYFYEFDDSIDYSIYGADRIYIPFSAVERPGFSRSAKAMSEAGTEVFLWLPAVTRGNTEKLIDRLISRLASSQLSSIMLDGILAGNIGTMHRLKEIKEIKLAGDISMNIFNSRSAAVAAGSGLDSIALSAELTLQQIHNLSKTGILALEAAVYGRLPLMISEYCPAGCVDGGFKASRRCSGCCGESKFRLRDRLGIDFPVLCDRIDCRSMILNSNVLFLPDGLRSLKAAGIGIFRLYVYDEEPLQIKELIRFYKASLSVNGPDMSSYRELADRIRAAGFTKGHYFRGV